MATQGPNFPGTTASLANAGTSENAEAWVSPGNIVSDNGTEASITAATYDSPDISQLLVASNFGFTIPDGARIDGITVEIDRRSIIASSGKDFRVQLAKGTAFANLSGSNKAVPATIWPTASGIASYGGAADLWGNGWTAAEINAASFAVMLSAQANIANADVGVDFIRVTVNYTLPTTWDQGVQFTNPQNHWRLGETGGATTAVDAEAAANGTYVGSPSQGQPGISNDGNTAVAFDGTDDTITVASSTPFRFAGVLPFSALVAFKHVPDGTFRRLLSCEDGANGQGWQIYSADTGAGFVRTGASGTELGVTVLDSGWHLFIATYDGTNMRLYLDGAEVGGSPLASSVSLPATSTFRIGSHSADVAFWNGIIDEPAVWTRALTSGEAASIWSFFTIPAAGGAVPTIVRPGIAYPEPRFAVGGKLRERLRSFTQLFGMLIGGPTTHQAAATLSGTGALTAAGIRTTAASGALLGTGAIAATPTRQLAAGVALSGTGAISAAGALARLVSAVLAGTGAISGSTAVTRQAAASVAGAGTLSLQATAVRGASAALAGAGSFSGLASIVVSASGSLTGTGALVGDATRVTPLGASLSGTGALGATSLLILGAGAVLAGQGTISAGGGYLRAAAATLAGTGSFSAVAGLSLSGEVGLTGTGSLSAGASRIIGTSAALAGAGTLAAAAFRTMTAGSALAGAGAITGDGSILGAGASASLTGSGTFGASASVTRGAQAGLAGAGAIVAGAIRMQGAVAALTGTGSASALASNIIGISAGLTGSGSTQADAGRTMAAAAGLSGTGSASAAAEIIDLTIVLAPGAYGRVRLQGISGGVRGISGGVKIEGLTGEVSSRDE